MGIGLKIRSRALCLGKGGALLIKSSLMMRRISLRSSGKSLSSIGAHQCVRGLLSRRVKILDLLRVNRGQGREMK